METQLNHKNFEMSQSVESATLLQDYCTQHNLLTYDTNGVLRLPFVVKGQIINPIEVKFEEIVNAFSVKDVGQSASGHWATYANLENVQVLREKVWRNNAKDWQHVYTVMPKISAEILIENDIERLTRDLYNMPFPRVLEFADQLRKSFHENSEFMDQLRETTKLTSELPDLWHDGGFASFDMLLDPKSILDMVNKDLTAWGIDGTKLLDSWQKLESAQVSPAPVNFYASMLIPDYEWQPEAPEIRALPTRQLHITAGNSPQIPLVSMLRSIATKSALVLKSPYGATTPGALIALAAAVCQPEHPLTQNMSVVYWPGGDRTIEDQLFLPNAFDRIVVWGAPEAVASVKSRSQFTKVVTFNPRYGLSFVGNEVFATKEAMKEQVHKAICDSLVANQKACIASQVHYVEGSLEQAREYAAMLSAGLREFDESCPNLLKPSVEGLIKRLQRGALIEGDWFENKSDGRYSSAVVVVENEFPMGYHPMSRFIVVRPVKGLREALKYIHPGVSTVSIAPAARKEGLRDSLAARGVSNIVSMGQSGRAYPGQPHDGMMVLTELVDWKSS